VQLIGHAGLAASRPGGTHDRAGLDAALGLDLARLEVDVALSGDGAIVLRHDLLLASGASIETTGLDRARAEAPGLLTLDEAVEHLAGRLPLLLDIKHDAVVDPLGAWAAGRADVDLFAVCTDGAEPLNRLRGRAPRLARWRTLPVYAPRPETTARHVAACALRRLLVGRLERLAAEVGAAAVTVDRWAVSTALCATARRLGLPLTAWTVNEPRVAARMRRRGADFVTTDQPRLLGASVRAGLG
jgi:glycerophosphoryl diester phosphodiesterase